MRIVEVDKSWDALFKPHWLQELQDTPFLTRCRGGAVTRDELYTYVRQQGYYSQHFTRYLSALMSNILNDRDRLDLTHNLFEEMGLGDMASVPHSKLYADMMANMGVRREDQPLFATTQALIDTMLDCCRSSSFMVGLGALCLGAEAIVPYLYSTVMCGFEAVGEPLERLNFFTLHIEGDDEHAVTMKRIIDRELAQNPSSRVDLEYGAAKAISARVGFLRALSERPVVTSRAA